MPARLLVLLSGSGRTLGNLLERIDAGSLDAEVTRVVASRECRGAEIARERAIPTDVVPGEIPADRLAELGADADLVVLAGYLKYVRVTEPFRGRIVNIHPALLPDFGGAGMYGDRVHRAVLDAYRAGRATESGCTVHLVDDEYDHGAILLQRRCPILPNDTVESLAARVFGLEKQAYPEAIAELIRRNTERTKVSH